jgi:hypothetical protein
VKLKLAHRARSKLPPALILRSPRASRGRLEGLRQGTRSGPSFETHRLSDAPQDEGADERSERFARGGTGSPFRGHFHCFPDCIFNAAGAGGGSGGFDKSQASASIFRRRIANPTSRKLL